jgi:hypothetical protein
LSTAAQAEASLAPETSPNFRFRSDSAGLPT